MLFRYNQTLPLDFSLLFAKSDELVPQAKTSQLKAHNMNNEPAPENEAELEAFRRRWREEVQSRNKNPQTQTSPERVKPQQRRKSTVQPSKPVAHASSSSTKKADEVDYDHFVPEPYHDLPNKDDALKLGVDGQGQEQQRSKALHEPKSALEHYEKAVEKEGHGQLGDSLNHYRKAFKVGLIPLLPFFRYKNAC